MMPTHALPNVLGLHESNCQTIHPCSWDLPPYSRCIMGEDKVASFDRLVAGKAGFKQRRVRSFAVFELSKPPAAGRGIFFRVFDHKLNVRGGSGHERLGTAKDFVVLFGRDITPG